MDERILAYSIRELGSLFRNGQLSPVDVVHTCLRRIEAVNPKLFAFISVTADAAIAQARQAERTLLRDQEASPLTGVPISVKDVFEMQGAPTTWGVKALAEFRSPEDATVVAKLRDAGAILLGKTNVDMYPHDGAPDNPALLGPTRNPWDRERTAGRSSGGSAAAVAAGLGYGSVGSDTVGSIRVPAAFCGVVGLMPTYGVVSTYRVFPYSLSFDHCGPLARSVYDSALILNAIAGYDPKDASSSRRAPVNYVRGLEQPVRGLRVGIPHASILERCDPEIIRLTTEAARMLAELGVTIREIDLPNLRSARWLHIVSFLESPAVVTPAEISGRSEQPFDRHVLRRSLGSRSRLLEWARASRQAMRKTYEQILRDVDVIVLPTVPVIAPRLTDDRSPWQLEDEPYSELISRYTRPFNFIHFPAMTLPCGFSTDGLPAGLQIVGGPFQEPLMLRVAHAYERETEWNSRSTDLPS